MQISLPAGGGGGGSSGDKLDWGMDGLPPGSATDTQTDAGYTYLPARVRSSL